MSSDLTEVVLVPVAHEEDMDDTADAIRTWFDNDIEIIHILHVIEKAGGAIDKAPLGLREEQAEEIFRRARLSLDDVAEAVETELRYSTSILEEIHTTAYEVEATSIVYAPRSGGRLTRLLSGDLTHKLVLNSSIPVVVLPPWGDREDGND